MSDGDPGFFCRSGLKAAHALAEQGGAEGAQLSSVGAQKS